MDASEPPAKLQFLCFGGAEWDSHHQRPHQLMQRFAVSNDVIYVDNLGTRAPRLRDIHRVARRLRSRRSSGSGRNAQRVKVIAPIVPSMQQLRPVRLLGRAALLRAAEPLIDRSVPLVVWTYLPMPVVRDAAESLGAAALVYDWVDDASARMIVASERHRSRVAAWEREMASAADVVFVASSTLMSGRMADNPDVHLVPHGAASPSSERAVAPELADLGRPVIGFVGSISDWIDIELLDWIAERRPSWSIVMVGPIKTDVARLRRRSNVILIGERPYDQISRFLSGFDVGVIPYRVATATNHGSPLKLHEYLAHGLPVVSTNVSSVQRSPSVEIAADRAGFLDALERSAAGRDPIALSSVRTWDEAAAEMIEIVTAKIAGDSPSRPPDRSGRP